MSYSAPNQLLMPKRQSIDILDDSWMEAEATAGTASAAWPTANMAIYIPLRIPTTVVVRKLWYATTTTATGNVDMGLYDATGAQVIGATAAAKVNAADEAFFDVTDTVVGPGRYYIAIASDSGTDTFIRSSPAAPILAAFGVLTETSAYPLPATATWTVAQTLAYLPVVGLMLEATPA